MALNNTHSWNITPTEAIAIQKELRSKVELTSLEKEIHLIGGADISFNKYSEIIYAGIVVLKLPELVEVTRSIVVTRTSFPYIPGLLSFRETPALLEAWEKLDTRPDVMILDGQGIAHPRRLGIATHFGLLTGIPSIGCAKSLLTGKYDPPLNKKGTWSSLMDQNEQIGVILRTRENVKPVFVSPGHKIDFATSVELVMRCCTKYRLPETTRLAHRLVNELRTSKLEGKAQQSLFS